MSVCGYEWTHVDTEIKASTSDSLPARQNIIYGPRDSLFSGRGKENMKWTEEKYSVRFSFCVALWHGFILHPGGDLYWKRGHVEGRATAGTGRDAATCTWRPRSGVDRFGIDGERQPGIVDRFGVDGERQPSIVDRFGITREEEKHTKLKQHYSEHLILDEA